MAASVLAESALVLNRNWVAVATTTVRDALVLLYRGAARAVCPETCETHDFESWSELSVARDEPVVRTVYLRIKVPEVILLRFYSGFPPREVVFSRRNLYRRDRYTCQYCGAQPGSSELTIDHIVPRSRGGKSTWENCVLACIPCNAHKGDRIPSEAGLLLRHPPTKPGWNPHLSLRLGSMRESWEQFISRKYWEIQLEE